MTNYNGKRRIFDHMNQDFCCELFFVAVKQTFNNTKEAGKTFIELNSSKNCRQFPEIKINFCMKSLFHFNYSICEAIWFKSQTETPFKLHPFWFLNELKFLRHFGTLSFN